MPILLCHTRNLLVPFYLSHILSELLTSVQTKCYYLQEFKILYLKKSYYIFILKLLQTQCYYLQEFNILWISKKGYYILILKLLSLIKKTVSYLYNLKKNEINQFSLTVQKQLQAYRRIYRGGGGSKKNVWSLWIFNYWFFSKQNDITYNNDYFINCKLKKRKFSKLWLTGGIN